MVFRECWYKDDLVVLHMNLILLHEKKKHPEETSLWQHSPVFKFVFRGRVLSAAKTGAPQHSCCFGLPHCVTNESRGTYFSPALSFLCPVCVCICLPSHWPDDLSVTLFPSSSVLSRAYSLWLITLLGFQRHGFSDSFTTLFTDEVYVLMWTIC